LEGPRVRIPFPPAASPLRTGTPISPHARQRLQRDLQAMSELPPAPFDACEQATGQVSSQSLVRYQTNNYSVPVAYGPRDVWVRGYVDQVVIGCGGEIIARHPRCYDRENMIFDPVHYLPLIEQKIGALGSGGAAGRMGPARGVPNPAAADGSVRLPAAFGICHFGRFGSYSILL